MSTGEFSVCQFFTDGNYEYVRRFVSGEEAVKAFKHYTDNVATKVGIVNRVIITDGGDCTNIEWRAGKGFTYDGETWAASPVTIDKALDQERAEALDSDYNEEGN